MGQGGLASSGFVYDLEYKYDQLGNRTEKIDHLTGATTTYIYDVEDREFYGSNSNRLMTYQVDDPSTGTLETVWYYYDADGNVNRIVRQYAGDAQYRATRLVYNQAGQVEYVVGQTCNEVPGSPSGPPCDDEEVDFQRTFAWQFRYDTARASPDFSPER